MSGKTNKTTTTTSPLAEAIMPLFIKLFQRVLLKLFMIPLYGAIAAPWLILLVENTSEATQQKFHTIVAFLAGKPGAETLNEGDLAIAVIVLLVLIQSGFILYDRFRGKEVEGGLKHRVSKRMLVTEIVLCVGGWTLLAINQYDELGIEGLIILPGMAMAVSALFFLENVLKGFFTFMQNTFFGHGQ